jgi:predicted dehydrogenase/threonine dehydrogenase-like Zn-dependent dehydrogenase
MKNVVQPLAGGPVTVLDVPRPIPGPTEVLVRTAASVIAPDTERTAPDLSRSGLLTRTRARPDLLREVARRARADGVTATMHAARDNATADLPLGYSAAGEVVEVGTAVTGIARGQLVATGGAGKASHAEFQAVPGLLCAPVPRGVPATDAAFATVSAIGLHGLRLADVGPGSKVVVIGLGLIGQLTSRLAIAAGCDVTGIDPAAHARSAAARAGVLALDELGDATTERVLRWSRGRGADAVLVCAATSSSAPARRAPALCRDRAAVVIVGDVGLMLDRAPFSQRELSLRFARSYGPGRDDPAYEAWGVDYPAGQVRWSEGRNLEAVLDLLATGRLAVSDLVTHCFGIDDAARAYELAGSEADPHLAVQLTYPVAPASEAPVLLRPPNTASESPGVGWIGPGAFSQETLLPAFRRAGFSRLVTVTSASGLTARQTADRHGFEKAVSGAFHVIDDPDVAVVVIATPHDAHAELATLALKDGRHVWCEKPLALTLDELDNVQAAWEASGRQLMIGFNRRWSPAVRAAQRALADVSSPRYLIYRVAAGPGPDSCADRRQGGRMLGEVCHFVDTAQALIGADITDAVSLLGAGGSTASADAIVSLRFADGSLATICYGSAQPAAAKEWIEITAGSRRLVIDDFRSAKLDSKTVWHGRRNHGHDACAAAFRAALTGGDALPTGEMLATTRATLQAAAGDGRETERPQA